jgi:predicted transcriptional regulator
VASLKEFLATEADKLQSEQLDAIKRRDEWVEAVDRLLAQIKDWLHQADPGRILTIEETTHKLREHGIGSYEAAGLWVGIGVRQVRVEPVARNVLGPARLSGDYYGRHAYGRVDMSNGSERFMIIRVSKGPDDHWSIMDEDRQRTDRFDQDSFEAALKGLLA